MFRCPGRRRSQTFCHFSHLSVACIATRRRPSFRMLHILNNPGLVVFPEGSSTAPRADEALMSQTDDQSPFRVASL